MLESKYYSIMTNLEKEYFPGFEDIKMRNFLSIVYYEKIDSKWSCNFKSRFRKRVSNLVNLVSYSSEHCFDEIDGNIVLFYCSPGTTLRKDYVDSLKYVASSSNKLFLCTGKNNKFYMRKLRLNTDGIKCIFKIFIIINDKI